MTEENFGIETFDKTALNNLVRNKTLAPVDLIGTTDMVYFQLGLIEKTVQSYGKEKKVKEQVIFNDKYRVCPSTQKLYLTKTAMIVVLTPSGIQEVGYITKDWKEVHLQFVEEHARKTDEKQKAQVFTYPNYVVTGENQRPLPKKLFETFSEGYSKQWASIFNAEDICEKHLDFACEVLFDHGRIKIVYLDPEEIGKLHSKIFVSISVELYYTLSQSERIELIKKEATVFLS
jgi:hypothetical protein